MNELALFAGAGGGILGGKLLGWRTVCAVEFDAHARAVLLARQADGCLERFPIWDDVRTFDGKPWRGRVDVVSGGFPCQDISVCGKGAGIDGERSGLWREMLRIVGEVRPRFVFAENSPALAFRGGHRIIGELTRLGYVGRNGVLGHDDAGGHQRRKRFWIVAHLHEEDFQYVEISRADSQQQGNAGIRCQSGVDFLLGVGEVAPSKWKPSGQDVVPEPCLVRKVDGFPDVVDRLARVGNSQVPVVAALAWRLLGGPVK